MRNRNGTHVYVAVSECGRAKIGATSNIDRRRGALRDFGGRRFRVQTVWPHDDPFAIEMMVCHALRLRGVESLGKEEFAISGRWMSRSVNKAIRTYARLAMSRRTRMTDVKAGAYWWMVRQ